MYMSLAQTNPSLCCHLGGNDEDIACTRSLLAYRFVFFRRNTSDFDKRIGLHPKWK